MKYPVDNILFAEEQGKITVVFEKGKELETIKGVDELTIGEECIKRCRIGPSLSLIELKSGTVCRVDEIERFGELRKEVRCRKE